MSESMNGDDVLRGQIRIRFPKSGGMKAEFDGDITGQDIRNILTRRLQREYLLWRRSKGTLTTIQKEV